MKILLCDGLNNSYIFKQFYMVDNKMVKYVIYETIRP